MVQMSRFGGMSALLAALISALLAGCGGAQPVQQDRFYSLAPIPLQGPSGVPAPAILQVNDLAARGFLGGRQIVYRTSESPQVVQRYAALLWEEPPSRAVAQALVAALREAKVFRFVVIPADRARADYLLSGEVERFEHHPTASPPRVAATINLALVRADDRSSMASRQYAGEEPVDAETPAAMARAFERLTARLVAEAVRDIQAVGSRLRASLPGCCADADAPRYATR